MAQTRTPHRLRESSVRVTELGYETGIDRLWCCLNPSPDRAYAILDDVSVRHVRPVGENSAAQGFSGGRNYQVVLEELEVLFGRPYTGTVACAGLARFGRLIDNRKLMSLLCLISLKDWRNNRSLRFVKRFLISLNYNLRRLINNGMIGINQVVRKIKVSA